MTPSDTLLQFVTDNDHYLKPVNRVIKRHITYGTFNQHEIICWVGATVLRKPARACFAQLHPDLPIEAWPVMFPPATRYPVAKRLVAAITTRLS